MDTYEKKYKEALERARDFKNNIVHKELTVGESIMDYIFPELRESDDERIRREIINYFKCQSREEPSRKDTHNKWIVWLEKVITPNHNDIDSSFIEDIKNVINEAPLLMQSDKEKMIDWLEKQGEQKSQRMISAEAKEAMYGKPAWTKEDDVRLQACIDALQAESLMGKVDTVMTKWLESLKQRIGGYL